jgi:hypothetical protein
MVKNWKQRFYELFQHALEIEVVGEISGPDGAYFLLLVVDDLDGGEFVVREGHDGTLEILGGDSVIESLEGIDIDPALARDLLQRDVPTKPDLEVYFPHDTDLESITAERRFLGQAELNQRVFDRCVSSLTLERMNSKLHSPPACKQGRLACAWAVNRIVSDIFGRPVGGHLSTINMYDVLRTNDRPLPASEYGPGCIIISPTAGNAIGHVGIVGRGDDIYSNSSSRGRWEQNFSIESWIRRYQEQLGLKIHRFELNPQRFPVPLTG